MVFRNSPINVATNFAWEGLYQCNAATASTNQANGKKSPGSELNQAIFTIFAVAPSTASWRLRALEVTLAIKL